MIAEIGLVTLCLLVAIFAASSALGCISPMLASRAVCSSSTALAWYYASLVAAVLIAVTGVTAAHVSRRWPVACLAVLVSVTLSVVTERWGLH